MDHSCHRCGAMVADNAPFCSQCGAPQIKVSLAPQTESGSHRIPPPPAHVPLNWRLALPRVLGAALIGTVLLMVFPLLLPPFLVVILIIPFTGAVSVWFYKTRDATIDGGKGFRLGAVTGFFLFLLNLIPIIVGYLINRAQFLRLIKAQLDQAAKTADLRTQEMIRNLGDHPETIAAIVALGAVFGLVMFTVASGIGGAIAGRGARHGS